mgnify:CR=1 FL=1
MALGASATHANAIVNVLRGIDYTGIAGLYVKLHTGDPGAAGTANASAVTTRNQLTLAAPSGGSASLSALAAYNMTATETISHFSLWTSATTGTFIGSGQLAAAKGVNNGDTLTFNSFTASITPVAA